jgi:hypothetical protein
MKCCSISEILTELNRLNSSCPSDKKQKYEISVDNIKTKIIYGVLVLFAVLLIMVGTQILIVSLSNLLVNLTLAVYCITVFLLIVFMAIDIGVTFYQVVKYKNVSFSWLLEEVKKDKSNADIIKIFEIKSLIEAKEWLEIKCSRIKGRIGFIFGSPEKIALFSLLGFGWIIFKEVFNKKIPGNFLFLSSDPLQIFPILILALFVGFSIGAVLLGKQLRRYTYYLEIIEIAINMKNTKLRV